MHVVSDSDLKASLLLADRRYDEVQAKKQAVRFERRRRIRETLATTHATEEKSLRCASKADKEAGTLKRAFEKATTLEELERDEMTDADEDSRVQMALLAEKLGAMDNAKDTHERRFSNPGFHFVPRRKMMQIQGSSLGTICQALDKSNRTNTWQKKDACVVEQCLSALALYLHRRPERCRELQESTNGVQSIVTAMRECAGDRFVQDTGLKLVADLCLMLASCAEAFVRVGLLETVVDTMQRLVEDCNLQVCGCEAISSLVAALPDDGGLLERALEADVHLAAARALRRYPRSERVLVAGMRAMETVTVRCGRNGRTSVQNAPSSSLSSFSTININSDDRTDSSISASVVVDNSRVNNKDPSLLEEDTYYYCTATGNNSNDDPQGYVHPSAHDSCYPETNTSAADDRSAATAGGGWRSESYSRGVGGRRPGATALALRVTDAYSRDDSRTIVRRAGAARVAGSALGLVRGLLTDYHHYCRRGRDGRQEEPVSSYPASCVDEFCSEKGVRVILSAMDHHVHDAGFSVAAWQAMHSVIRLAAREQRNNVSAVSAGGGESKHAGESKHDARRDEDEHYDETTDDDAEEELWKGNVCDELLRRKENLDGAARAAAQSMELHAAVAPLQWICLVCLIELHALEETVSGAFMAHGGGQILRRCIRTNARHTAVVEQGCRAVAVMAEASFTFRTRLIAEKIQDAIHEVVYLHRTHPGVQALGNRALDSLWGKDEFGAKQKAAAAERSKANHKEQEQR